MTTPALQEVEFPIVPCKSHIDKAKELCAGSPYKDACRGDSGGPLFMNSKETGNQRKSRRIQVGVVSRGDGDCRNKIPGIYTRVSFYMNWIRSQLEE